MERLMIGHGFRQVRKSPTLTLVMVSCFLMWFWFRLQVVFLFLACKVKCTRHKNDLVCDSRREMKEARKSGLCPRFFLLPAWRSYLFLIKCEEEKKERNCSQSSLISSMLLNQYPYFITHSLLLWECSKFYSNTHCY